MGISTPSRRIRIQFEGNCRVRFCPSAIPIGIGMVSQLVASRIRNTSVTGRPSASCPSQPVIFSVTTLRKVIFPEKSVQMTASPMQLSVV